ncbi:hypothetical protein AB0I99_04000 [Streptomyces spongiicola]|uniref:hypothetical protein n=1 Tax=Streptomyces spongiicola TaxID=1690221 RepID=UPI0034043D47
MTVNISRRAALRRVAFVVTGTALGSQALSLPAQAAGNGPEPDRFRKEIRRMQERNERVMTGLASKNGWEMEKVADAHGHIYTRPVPGTPLDGVQMRMAEVETVLMHVISRFHYEIDALRKGDVVGWRKPGSVRKGIAESNLASGTAVQIRPGSYPSGARGGFYPMEEFVVRDILAECEGVVRWGGDDNRPDESLFYIDVPPDDERLAKVAAKIRDWNYTPGRGSGVLVDHLQPDRRKDAKRLAASQS